MKQLDPSADSVAQGGSESAAGNTLGGTDESATYTEENHARLMEVENSAVKIDYKPDLAGNCCTHKSAYYTLIGMRRCRKCHGIER